MAKQSKENPSLLINKDIARGFLLLDKIGGAESVKRAFFAALGYGYPDLKAPPQNLSREESFLFMQLCMDRDACLAKYAEKSEQASDAAKLSKGISRNQGNQNARKAPSPPPPQVAPIEDSNSEESRAFRAFLGGTETAEQKARREANFSELESVFDKIAREEQEQAQKQAQERASSDELSASDESSEEEEREEIREPQTPKEKQLESDAQTIKREIAQAWKISSDALELSWRDLERLPQLRNIKGSTTRELLRRCSLEKQARAAREFIAEQGSLELGDFLEEMLGAMARSGWRG